MARRTALRHSRPLDTPGVPMTLPTFLVMIGRAGRCAAVLLFAVLAACATTQLQASWKDPAFTGPPMKQLLVIGAFKSDLNRRVFEDAFVGALRGANTAG